MRGGRRGANFSIYWRALPYLVRNPSILALPLLAAVLSMLVSYTGQVSTDPLGGLGTGLFQQIIQIVYLFAFGVAIIQANNIVRGYKTKFDDAWEEARRKAGSIFIAAFGFQFVAWVAGLIGGFIAPLVGNPSVSVGLFAIGIPGVLQVITYFFLILTIPAAAIGGSPGGLALSASIRAVRANIVPCIVLAVVFVLLFLAVPYVVAVLVPTQSVVISRLADAVASAIMLGYLAFPFASTYDDIAFKLW